VRAGGVLPATAAHTSHVEEWCIFVNVCAPREKHGELDVKHAVVL
jgi:hypothetical protein